MYELIELFFFAYRDFVRATRIDCLKPMDLGGRTTAFSILSAVGRG